MDLVVCVKQVPDPEAPPSGFRVDETGSRVVLGQSVSLVISPFDEQAVEAALRLKDAHGGKVTVLSLGTATARDVLKHAMAMGADEGVLLGDGVLDGSDSGGTAYALAQAIQKIGIYDVVLCGRQASDWDAGQVGMGIAHFLGLPCVTLARKVEAANGKLRVERIIPDGYEVVEAELPAVVTVSNEIGNARYPTLRGIMAAGKKEVTRWGGQDIGVDPSKVGVAGRRMRQVRLFLPEYAGKCEIIEGDSAAQAAEKLALRLREVKVI